VTKPRDDDGGEKGEKGFEGEICVALHGAKVKTSGLVPLGVSVEDGLKRGARPKEFVVTVEEDPGDITAVTLLVTGHGGGRPFASGWWAMESLEVRKADDGAGAQAAAAATVHHFSPPVGDGTPWRTDTWPRTVGKGAEVKLFASGAVDPEYDMFRFVVTLKADTVTSGPKRDATYRLPFSGDVGLVIHGVGSEETRQWPVEITPPALQRNEDSVTPAVATGTTTVIYVKAKITDVTGITLRVQQGKDQKSRGPGLGAREVVLTRANGTQRWVFSCETGEDSDLWEAGPRGSTQKHVKCDPAASAAPAVDTESTEVSAAAPSL
jgi:hypothetical protein